MICKSCGNELKEGSTCCSVCGALVKRAAVEPEPEINCEENRETGYLHFGDSFEYEKGLTKNQFYKRYAPSDIKKSMNIILIILVVNALGLSYLGISTGSVMMFADVAFFVGIMVGLYITKSVAFAVILLAEQIVTWVISIGLTGKASGLVVAVCCVSLIKNLGGFERMWKRYNE